MTDASAAHGALDGIRVLDATQMLAGPLAATRLGDLGADVIKIEPPRGGEFNRTHGFDDIRVHGEMTTFLAVNRNKRSLAVDLKHPESRAVIADLVREADVFIQNFRHGTAERLGVGYEQLREINPRLVYCSISGYGSWGPYRDRPGQDLVVQGYSGSMFSVGSATDDPEPGALWAADVMTGYQAAIGILAALTARDRLGVGQKVEVDMLSIVLDAQLQEFVTYLNTGRQPQRSAEPSAHAFIPAPYGVYRTSDGWLTLAMTPLAALGEVLDDDWLRSLTDYNDGHNHRDEVYRHIRHAFEHETTAHWLERCDRVNVWAGPVLDYAGVAEDPHVVETGMLVDQPYGDDGETLRTVRPPLRMSETPPAIRRGAPVLGADTADILADLGWSPERIERAAASGTLASDPETSPPRDARLGIMSRLGGRGLHGQVVNELGGRIMRGEIAPGSTIDPEGVAREFDVSRTVVREALKALTAKGLVGARPRFGTYVADRSHWQLLDTEVMVWRSTDEPDPRLVTELDEVRLIVEPAAARMAAERRTPEQLERIARAWDGLDRSYRTDDPYRPDHAEADLEFHRAVLAASGNELLERFEVILAPALQARDRLAHRHMTTLDFLDGHHAVYAAIEAADPDAALLRMRALMELSASDSAAALNHTRTAGDDAAPRAGGQSRRNTSRNRRT